MGGMSARQIADRADRTRAVLDALVPTIEANGVVIAGVLTWCGPPWKAELARSGAAIEVWFCARLCLAASWIGSRLLVHQFSERGWDAALIGELTRR